MCPQPTTRILMGLGMEAQFEERCEENEMVTKRHCRALSVNGVPLRAAPRPHIGVGSSLAGVEHGSRDDCPQFRLG